MKIMIKEMMMTIDDDDGDQHNHSHQNEDIDDDDNHNGNDDHTCNHNDDNDDDFANKYNYQQDISEPSPKCESQELNFQQYCETLNKQCNQISEQQKDQTHPCEFSANPQNYLSLHPNNKQRMMVIITAMMIMMMAMTIMMIMMIRTLMILTTLMILKMITMN